MLIARNVDKSPTNSAPKRIRGHGTFTDCHKRVVFRDERNEGVFGIPVELPTAARARWLAEVAETLEQAEGLLDRLKLGGLDSLAAAEVTVRIEAAKLQVESLRTKPRTEIDPKWTNLPWDQRQRPSA